MDKTTVKILVAVGCAFLGLAGCVVAVAVGLVFYGMAGVDEPVYVAPLAPPPVAEPLPPLAGDPRDAALGAYVNEAARTIVDASRGVPHDTRWNGADPTRDLRGTAVETRAQVAALGPSPEILFTALELEATDGSARVRSNCLVFPDGRIAWVNVQHDTIETRPTPGLAVAAPALAGAITRLLESLAGSCDLPRASPTDLPPTMPAEARADLMRGVEGIDRACGTVASAAGWQPKVDDITVLVSGNGRFGALRSSFESDGSALALSAVRFRAPD